MRTRTYHLERWAPSVLEPRIFWLHRQLSSHTKEASEFQRQAIRSLQTTPDWRPRGSETTPSRLGACARSVAARSGSPALPPAFWSWHRLGGWDFWLRSFFSGTEFLFHPMGISQLVPLSRRNISTVSWVKEWFVKVTNAPQIQTCVGIVRSNAA